MRDEEKIKNYIVYLIQCSTVKMCSQNKRVANSIAWIKQENKVIKKNGSKTYRNLLFKYNVRDSFSMKMYVFKFVNRHRRHENQVYRHFSHALPFTLKLSKKLLNSTLKSTQVMKVFIDVTPIRALKMTIRQELTGRWTIITVLHAYKWKLHTQTKTSAIYTLRHS